MKTQRIWIAAGLSAALLSACQTKPDIPTPAPPPPPNAPTRPARIVIPPARPEKPDTCGAKKLQYLVGKPRTEAPVPLDPSRRRMVCSSCPVTLDYSAQRLNIIYDATTGLVTEVKCG